MSTFEISDGALFITINLSSVVSLSLTALKCIFKAVSDEDRLYEVEHGRNWSQMMIGCEIMLMNTNAIRKTHYTVPLKKYKFLMSMII